MNGLPIAAASVIALVAKATLVLSFALILAWFLRRGSARTLHLLWTTTFSVLLALPVLALLGPSWRVPILPVRTTAIERHIPVNTASDPSSAATPLSAGRQPHPGSSIPDQIRAVSRSDHRSIPPTPTVGVFLIWALGCGAGLISLAVGALRFRTLVRGAIPIRDPDWIRSTDALRQRLRVRGGARILSSTQVATPMTGGPLRPVVLLPASAQRWTCGRREMVVSHELVHARRRDALWRLVGGAVVALYWFHPLIWLASRFAAAEMERSCDEEVLALGVLRPSAYARHLFSLASEIAPGPPVLSLPVVQHPHLESRIMSILKLHRPRFSRVRTYTALALVGVVGMVAACARPVPRDPGESPAPQAEIARLDERPAESPAPPGNPEPVSAQAPDRMPGERLATASSAPSPPAPEALASQEIECEPRSFTGIMRDRESTTMRVSVDGMALCMRTSGEVVMTGDGTAVASMDPGSRLVLASRAERLHRMAITSGPGGLVYEWSIDGRSQPLDDEARDWRNLMLTVLARSREAWDVRAKEGRLRREIGSHERHVAGLRREIASHERHVAGLRRETASHERQVAGLRREIASHERHVASLEREIASHERHVAGLHRQIAGHERQVASLRRGMARMISPETQEALQVEMVRAEGELRSTRQAIGEYDLDQQVREIRQEIERYDLDVRVRDIEDQIERYDLDGKVRDIEDQIERYDLDGKVQDIKAQIEQYDLDGRIRQLEAQIEEWDADHRAEEIERSIQDDVAALRRLIHAAERRR